MTEDCPSANLLCNGNSTHCHRDEPYNSTLRAAKLSWGGASGADKLEVTGSSPQPPLHQGTAHCTEAQPVPRLQIRTGIVYMVHTVGTTEM